MPPMDALRAFMSFASRKRNFKPSDIQQADVITAFLQADLHSSEPVYVIPPKEHIDHGKYLWLILKGANGLRDSPRAWFLHCESILGKLGWVRTIYDSVYVRFKNGEIDAVLLIWVDDILVCSGQTSAIDVLKEIGKNIEIELRGIPKKFVGLDINVTSKYIEISQQTYASSLEVEHCGILQNPLPLNVLHEEDNSPLLTGRSIKAYRSLRGCYAYLQHTRPDLCFSISFFGKVTHAPTERMFRLLYRACQYAKQTSKRGLKWNVHPSSTVTIKSWCDASFGSHINSAQTGFIVCIDDVPIIWKSGVQKRSHHSTVKAECESMHDCIDRLLLLIYFLSELQLRVVKCSLHNF